MTSDPAHFAQLDKSALIRDLMGEIRYLIIAKQCEVAGKLSILDECLEKSFSLVYDHGKPFLTPISYRQFSLQPNTVLLYYPHVLCGLLQYLLSTKLPSSSLKGLPPPIRFSM